MSTGWLSSSAPPAYAAARRGLAYRFRETAVVDVTGDDRVEFLQGQLTQDLRGASPGETRPAAALTPKGKLLFVARVVALSDRLRLLLPTSSRAGAREHLQKYALFRKVAIEDASDRVLRVGLYGRAPDSLPERWTRLPGEGEFAAEILAPVEGREALEGWLSAAGLEPVDAESAEILRVEAGRPRFGTDADESNLPDEIGLDSAISTTKGCYVGQEIVARLRTYGRVNRRLVGFRFPEGIVTPGSRLIRPEEAKPGKIETGRVTSAAHSPAFGAIGLGFAFREVGSGERLRGVEAPGLPAIVSPLPFA